MRLSFSRLSAVCGSALSGLIAGVLASGVLVGLLLWIRNVSPEIFDAVGWEMAAIVFAALTLAGIAVGVLATVVAVNRYLRRSYEDVHRA